MAIRTVEAGSELQCLRSGHCAAAHRGSPPSPLSPGSSTSSSTIGGGLRRTRPVRIIPATCCRLVDVPDSGHVTASAEPINHRPLNFPMPRENVSSLLATRTRGAPIRSASISHQLAAVGGQFPRPCPPGPYSGSAPSETSATRSAFCKRFAAGPRPVPAVRALRGRCDSSGPTETGP